MVLWIRGTIRLLFCLPAIRFFNYLADSPRIQFLMAKVMKTSFLISLLSLVHALMLPAFSLAQYTPGNTYFGANNYIEYHAGDLPIIISAPHGGYLTPASIPDRACSGCTTVRDGWTEELAYKIDSAIQVVFGGHPHIIINKLARTKLDANREIVEAALGNPIAEAAWFEYHDFVQASKDACVGSYGTALYIDLHAHGHAIQRIELGYLLTRTELQLSDATLDAQNFQDSCSIQHLKNVQNPAASFSSILRGSDCMGELLTNRGYPSTPSASDPAPAPTDPYFSGGYNTVRHGSRDSSVINGIQFETNYTGIRNNNANRDAFARGLTCAIRSYLDQWYFDLDNWDPGHLVTSNADAGPGTLRNALLGAEDGTVITFDGALSGDTIRLEKELRLCSDVTIQGPGAGLLAVSGEGSTRILRIMRGNTVEVSGLSLVKGWVPAGQDAGAVMVEGSIRLTHCTIADNFASDDGGAIVVLDSFSMAHLDSCMVSGNSCGDDGGAMRCLEGTLVLNGTTVHDNFSPSNGGGLSGNGNVIIKSSTFSQNLASSNGGAIRNFGGGTVDCTNSTFAGNISSYRGGGISSGAHVDLEFCTLVNNTATSLGGGIRLPTGGTCNLRNTLVAGNSGSGGADVSMFSGAFVSNGNNLIGDTTGSGWTAAAADQLGNTASPVDPLVLSLAANGGPTETVALQTGSPCLEQGNAAGAPAFDQRGHDRVFGLQPDIGAFEFCIPDTSTDVIIACNTFTWIDGNTYTQSNNTAQFMAPNAHGCDSLKYLDLTINLVDTSIVQLDSVTLSANASGASYQWLDCANNFAVLVGETNQQLVVSNTGTYAVEITENGCIDTSACMSILLTGISVADYNSGWVVYPNPTTGHFVVELDQRHSTMQVTIRDAYGRLVGMAQFEDTAQLELDLEGAAGLYFIELSDETGESVYLKVLKE